MADQVHRTMNQNPYQLCILAKKNKPKIQQSQPTDSSDLQVGELISGDIMGKIQAPTRDGDVYFYLFMD
jgi:hypothetical protein